MNHVYPSASLFIKKVAEKHPYAAAKAAVGEIQNHKCQRQQPKKADGQPEEHVNEPQRQQAGKKGDDWIFDQIVHGAKVDLLIYNGASRPARNFRAHPVFAPIAAVKADYRPPMASPMLFSKINQQNTGYCFVTDWRYLQFLFCSFNLLPPTSFQILLHLVDVFLQLAGYGSKSRLEVGFGVLHLYRAVADFLADLFAALAVFFDL